MNLMREVENIEIKKRAHALVDSFMLHANRLNLSGMWRRRLLHVSLGAFKDIATLPLELGAYNFNSIVIFLCIVYGLIWRGIIGATVLVLISQSWLWILLLKEHLRKQRIRKTEGWEVEKEQSEQALKYLQKTKKA